jgi:bifunctional non-homologous end joining protein LigD
MHWAFAGASVQPSRASTYDSSNSAVAFSVGRPLGSANNAVFSMVGEGSVGENAPLGGEPISTKPYTSSSAIPISVSKLRLRIRPTSSRAPLALLFFMLIRLCRRRSLYTGMLRMRTLPAGFIEPCLPTKADTLPSGGLWIHEIKHDGFRIIARKDGPRVRLYSRPGNDLTDRFSLIVEALGRLRSRSCIIDGEAVACGDDGMPSFERIRYRRHDASVFLYAFDLIELNGDDLRREPLEVRKATLASVLTRAGSGLRLNEHLEHEDGEIVFHHACKLGLEGIVSKRKGSPYRFGRSPDWLKMKNPEAPAVKREAEEDWGKR